MKRFTKVVSTLLIMAMSINLISNQLFAQTSTQVSLDNVQVTTGSALNLTTYTSDSVTLSDLGAAEGTDITALFQESVNNYKTVILPQGQYKVSDSIYIDKQVEVMSQNATILYEGSSNQALFVIGSYGAGSQIDGLTVNGNMKALVEVQSSDAITFTDIKGTIKDNGQDNQSLYIGNGTNGSTTFDNLDLTFEALNTLIQTDSAQVATSTQVTVKNSDITIETMSDNFIDTNAYEVVLKNNNLEFGQSTFTKFLTLYRSAINLTIEDNTIEWVSDHFRLTSSTVTVNGYDQSILIDDNQFLGDKANSSWFIHNGIKEDHDFVFTNNVGNYLVPEGRDASSITSIVHSKYVASFNHTYSNNQFFWGNMLVEPEEPVETEEEKAARLEAERIAAEQAAGIYSILVAGAVANAGIQGNSIVGTDATEAFQYAVDNYNVIKIPEGQYRIDGTVVITRPVEFVGQGGVILTSPVNGNKKPVFDVAAGGSGTIFTGLVIKSINAYTADMPNDTPSSLTSNRIFINGYQSKNLVIEDVTTENMMFAVHGMGLDGLSVKNSNFSKGYINIWIGDTTGATFEGLDLSTNSTADAFAHNVYIGFDTKDITLKNLELSQTSDKGGALIYMANEAGQPDTYYIENLKASNINLNNIEAQEAVIHANGVKNAVFTNINGTVKANTNLSFYKAEGANQSITFKTMDLTVEGMNTLIASDAANVAYNNSVTFEDGRLQVLALNDNFLESFVETVTFDGMTLVFGQDALSKFKTLYGRNINLNFLNSDITWASDHFRLTGSTLAVDGYELNVVIDGSTFTGETVNASWFVVNGVKPHSFTFTDNHAINIFPEGRATDDISALLNFNSKDIITYTYNNNTFDWDGSIDVVLPDILPEEETPVDTVDVTDPVVETPVEQPEEEPVETPVEEPIEEPVEEPVVSPEPTPVVPEDTEEPIVVTDGYSVLEAGAVADAYILGSEIKGSDATAAFQYAVDNYDTIIIPAGSYRLSGKVTISRPITMIGENSTIYADPVSGTKRGIFFLTAGASGSTFQSMDVRSIDKYLVYMPNDRPTASSSNLAFLYGSHSTDILVKDTETHNLMYSVHGFGMDRLEIDNCSFEENYINMWFGDVKDVYIHDSFFSTSPTADIYAHTIYVGFDTDGVKIRNLTVEQKSEECGSILNFAWVSGNLGQYYIHDVDVDGVTILPSYTVNQVVQLYGVENASFKNITGHILDSSVDGSGTALVKMSNSNGHIAFDNIDIQFDELTTLVRATEKNIDYNQKVSIDNSNITIKKLSGHFIRPFVKEVVVTNSTIEFEKGAMSPGQGLLESGELVVLDNCQILFDDYMRLSSSINQADNNPLEIIINGTDFIGNNVNGSYFAMNGVNMNYDFTFTNNRLVNMFAEGRNTEDISWMVHPKYFDEINETYSGNSFEWK